MVFYFKVYLQYVENPIYIYSKSIAVSLLSLMNSSFSVLPLIYPNELTNLNVLLWKGMIGGKTDNGKGDTNF